MRTGLGEEREGKRLLQRHGRAWTDNSKINLELPMGWLGLGLSLSG